VLLGAFATRYASSDDTRQTDSIGASAGLGYEWTPAHKAEFTVLAERTEIEDRMPALFEDTVTTIGGQVSLVRTTVLTDTRLIVGRLIQPTGGGGIFESDHFQLQFDRRLSERLTLRSAALYTQNHALSDADTNSDSDYANGEISLRWSATRTWYIFGGYRYIWQNWMAPRRAPRITAFSRASAIAALGHSNSPSRTRPTGGSSRYDVNGC
jgi:hypothetical protein